MRRLAIIALAALAGCGFKEVVSDGGAGSDAGCTVDCAALTVADRRNGPVDLVVHGGYVYWTEQGTAAKVGADGLVARAPTSGCAAGDTGCPAILHDMVHTPAGLALSPDGTELWHSELTSGVANSASGRIWHLSLGAGQPPTIFVDLQDQPRAVASDVDSVYWLTTGSGALWGIWNDGTGGPSALVPGLIFPTSMWVDPAGGALFYTDTGGNDFDGVVVRVDHDGMNPLVLASQQKGPRGLTVGPTSVYWVDTSNGTLMRVGRDGTGLMPLLSDLATPTDVALDSDWVYFTEGGSAPYYQDGRIGAVRLDGSDRRTLADMQKYPRALAADGDYVYWVARGDVSTDAFNGGVYRVGKPR